MGRPCMVEVLSVLYYQTAYCQCEMFYCLFDHPALFGLHQHDNFDDSVAVVFLAEMEQLSCPSCRLQLTQGNTRQNFFH